MPKQILDTDTVAREYRAGATGPEIAARYGTQLAAVYHHLDKAGVPRRPSNHTRQRDVPVAELRRLLASKELTIDQIAEHFGVAVATIVRRMRHHGLRSQRGHGSPGPANFFWQGGQRREKEGYRMVWMPNHPHAAQNGYVREHRLVMERHLGRYLDPQEVVHHRDGDPTNNDPENLEVFANHSEHMQHEWQENWYPALAQQQARSQRRRRQQDTSSRTESGTDGAASQ